MSAVRDQRPSGGCANCGGPVRTCKAWGWVCASCARLLRARDAGRLVDGQHPIQALLDRRPGGWAGPWADDEVDS